MYACTQCTDNIPRNSVTLVSLYNNIWVCIYISIIISLHLCFYALSYMAARFSVVCMLLQPSEKAWNAPTLSQKYFLSKLNNRKLKRGSSPIKKGFITLMGFFPLEIRAGTAFDNDWPIKNELTLSLVLLSDPAARWLWSLHLQRCEGAAPR